MKILIYGLARTRSTYLLDVLCKHYKLSNYLEPYHGVLVKRLKETTPAHKYNTLWDLYKTKHTEITNDLAKSDNFGLKIFSSGLLNWVKFSPNMNLQFPNYAEIRKEDLIDIFEYHNVDMYDKIFVVHRENLVDRFCSFEHAHQHSNFLFLKGQEKLAKIYSPKNKLMDYKYYDVKFSLFTVMLHEHLCQRLMSRKNNIIKLDYEEIPNFVEKYYPNVDSVCAENFYDYKNKVRNYNQVFDDFEKAKLELQKEGIPELIASLFPK